MAMEAERKLEIAARIRELRGHRPQPAVASEVGVTLRAYQHWEAGGGIAWENIGKLAAALGVSEDYLLYGEEGKGSTAGTQLERIERKLDEVLTLLRSGAGRGALNLPDLPEGLPEPPSRTGDSDDQDERAEDTG